MSVAFAYAVNEEGEPFGCYVSEVVPNVGDIIQLSWIDGRPAYRARVVSKDGFHLDVEAIIEKQKE